MTETAQVDGEGLQDSSIRELMRRDGTGRPVEEIVRALAQKKLAEADEILSAIDERWSPPPYDPFLVAQALGIRCMPVRRPDLDEAMIFVKNGVPTILYREERSSVRTNFNIFHEIAHILFPDYQYNDFYRRARRPKLFEPEGQLEYLCDVAAAEFLMPMDHFSRDLQERGQQVRVVYTAPSAQFRKHRIFIPISLILENRSCIHQAARSKKPAIGEESLDLGRGAAQRFYIEALPLTARRRRNGHTPVLTFLYPR
jgi:Zn-dependent peptidase ImmA (M78 family)